MLGLGKAEYHAQNVLPEVLISAADVLRVRGDVAGAAEAEGIMADYWSNHGDPVRGLAHVRRAADLVAEAPPSWAKAWVLSSLAYFLIFVEGDDHAAVRVSQKALSIAEPLGFRDVCMTAWMWIGLARLHGGDILGRDDLRRGVAIARDIQSPEASLTYGNVAECLRDLGVIDAAVRHAEMVGSPHWLTAAQASQVRIWYFAGEWDAAIAKADELLAAIASGRHGHEPELRLLRACIRAARGAPSDATADLEAAVEWGRRSGEPEVVIPALSLYASNLASCGRSDEATAIADELLDRWRGDVWGQWGLGAFAYVARVLGYVEPFQKAAARATLQTPWLSGALAIAAGEFRRAACIYGRIGSRPDEAAARFQMGRELMNKGSRARGEAEVNDSLAFWRRVGATAYVREAEGFLARPPSLTPRSA
jgi:hypothetical protein